MAAFDYFLSVTGDCSSTSAGVISLSLTGGTPPYTIEWVDPNLGVTITTEEFPIFQTGLSATTYGVRVNDSTLDENLEFYINIPVSSGCCGSIVSIVDTNNGESNGSVTLTTTSGFSSIDYNLYTINDELVYSQTNSSDLVQIGNLSAGTYYLTVDDFAGCSGITESFIIKSSTTFDYGFYVINNSSCYTIPTGKIYITGQTNPGPYSYLWVDNTTGSTLTGLTSGIYSVKVTDGQGNEKIKTIEVSDADAMGVVQIIPTQPTCFTATGALDITISGGTAPFYYSANTGYYEISYDRNIILTGLTSGSFDINVIDAGLCILDLSATLNTDNGVSSVSLTVSISTC